MKPLNQRNCGRLKDRRGVPYSTHPKCFGMFRGSLLVALGFTQMSPMLFDTHTHTNDAKMITITETCVIELTTDGLMRVFDFAD